MIHFKFSNLKKRIKQYFIDTLKIFSPLFIKNRYYLHLGLSFMLTIPSILIMMFFLNLNDTGLFFQSFIGGFGAGVFNLIREWYYEKYYNAPYDGTFVELGYLREGKYSVDVLWYQSSPEEFIPYEIWDIEGNGSHTFLGWDFNPDEQYL